MYAEIWVVLSVKINNDRNKYSRENPGIIHEIQQPFGKKSKFVFHKEVSFLLFVLIFLCFRLLVFICLQQFSLSSALFNLI